MDTDGFLVLPHFLEKPFPFDVEQYRNKTQYIFNGAGKNDHRRSQSDIPERVLRSLKEKIEQQPFVDAVHQIRNFVLLKSLPGCQRQQAHTDYIPDVALKLCPANQIPLLFLFALEDSTRLVVWPGSHKVVQGLGRTKLPIKPHILTLNAGDAVVFRADLVHAGAEYESENVRIHCYIDSTVVPRKPNQTFIIQKHADSLIQGNILTSE